MNKFKSHFKFNKQERSGVFFLLLLIMVLQGVYFYIKAKPFEGESKISVNTALQSKVDSLRLMTMNDEAPRIFPFNPNYLTDYKGYVLGLSPQEMDRLFAYRKKGEFINSDVEFQQVTKVSDSLLRNISPYFKFPEWKKRNKSFSTHERKSTIAPKTQIQDLNTATAEELKTVYGIGDKLSARIVKFRDRLGGFLVDEQLYDVYGLEPEVANRALKKFSVIDAPKMEKINLNVATVEEIARLIYITTDVAQEIVALRNEKGTIRSFEELFNISGFPINKIDRIKLYLSL